MTTQKLLIASDLHYSRNLVQEIDAVNYRLPPGEYDHMRDGRLVWHNEMLVEEMSAMLDALRSLAEQEASDAVIFLGDLVSTNWAANVTDVADALRTFPCPVEMVTGNHDIYLAEPETRLQEAVAPGEYATGVRTRCWGDLGVILLDLFVHYADGAFRKWLDPHAEITGFNYRPQDIDAALEHMAAHADTPFLVCGHFPMCSPAQRIAQPGRRLGRTWRGGAALYAQLTQPNNLLGIVCGHQHCTHLQPFEHGFHWTAPALVEYPCAAALIDVERTASDVTVHGRLARPDPSLSQRSLRVTNQTWTYGDARDRAFTLHYAVTG